MNNSDLSGSAEDIVALIKQIKPFFAGKPSAVLGPAIADLAALWLAGHYVVGNADATRQLRDDLLKNHVSAIRALVHMHAKTLGTKE